jgi:hypothetical protein
VIPFAPRTAETKGPYAEGNDHIGVYRMQAQELHVDQEQKDQHGTGGVEEVLPGGT